MSTTLAVIIVGLALAAAAALLVALAIVVAGIHAAERRKSLPHVPRSQAEAIARRVLGVRTARARQAHRPHVESRR